MGIMLGWWAKPLAGVTGVTQGKREIREALGARCQEGTGRHFKQKSTFFLLISGVFKYPYLVHYRPDKS